MKPFAIAALVALAAAVPSGQAKNGGYYPVDPYGSVYDGHSGSGNGNGGAGNGNGGDWTPVKPGGDGGNGNGSGDGNGGNGNGGNGNGNGDNNGSGNVPSIDDFCPRSGLVGNPFCCTTDVLNLLDLRCEIPTQPFSSLTSLKQICQDEGREARCCAIPLIGQGVICEDTL
ncbi:hypothetical protein CDD82_6401 [Ophiocordyceps australis]|uniref:Hydrophobin n=1 Tax=Ophiocordyceps australis TaxID=1399860 RepID=A0A2C5YX46_9HYPO|nr:hypothetical protein CDD82_6401 [Ophiocordyceps australis]